MHHHLVAWFLVPGVGAQGGSIAEALAGTCTDAMGSLINKLMRCGVGWQKPCLESFNLVFIEGANMACEREMLLS